MAINGWLEFGIENGRPVDLTLLRAGQISDDTYNSARRTILRGCHDLFLQVERPDGERGILLVLRDNQPAKGELWCLGGGIKRGGEGIWDPANSTRNTEESLHKIALRESGLEIKGDMDYLGCARVYWATNPATGNGVDELGHCFFGRADGQIKLDPLHKAPRIVTPREYSNVKEGLHPYMKAFMDRAMPLVR